MSPRRRKILKIAAFACGGLVIFLAALLIAFRIVLAHAPEYRLQVQRWVSDRTGLDIQFSRMDARLRFYGPELVFDSAVVRSRDGRRTFVSAKRVSLGFDAWAAIGSLRLAGRLVLERPDLQVIRTTEGRIEVVGQSELPARDPAIPFKPDAIPAGRLQVVDARVSFRDLKTGRGPWVVPGVSFDLKRSGRAMHLQGEAELPAKLGKSLRFSADTEGRLAEAEDLRWQFDIAARELDLAGWTELSPKDFPAPRQGRGSFVLSGIFQGTNVSELAAQVQFNNVTLTLPAWRTPLPEVAKLEQYAEEDEALEATTAPSAPLPTAQALNVNGKSATAQYTSIGFALRLTHTRDAKGDDWHVRVKDLQIARPNAFWRPGNFSVDASRATNGAMNVGVQADLLVLENVWPLLAYGKESTDLAHIRALNASGRLSELKVEFARAPDASLTYAVKGRFMDLSLDAIDKAPGIVKISGAIEGDEKGGHVDLNVRRGALDLPRYFRTSLPIEKLTGTAWWRYEDAGWRVGTDALQIETIDGRAQANGEVLIPPNGASPVADVHAIGMDLVARSAPRYMPASKMPRKVLEWLDRAFTAGAVPHAEFVLRGPLRQFPFRNDEGLFLITANIVGLGLDYQPNWLPATNLKIDAEFRNVGMSATVLDGEVNGLRLTAASGKIADFKHAELVLDAAINGDLSQALPYIQQSPVGPAIGRQFMALKSQGNIEGQVRIRLPFKDIEKRKLSVTTKIANATVATDAVTQAVSELKGSLRVEDHALYSLDLQGKFLEGPVSIKGGADSRYTGRGAGLQIAAQGRARGTQLAALLHLPEAIPLGGAMQWQFVARSPRHPPDDPAKPTYIVDSDTRGLSVTLPEPIGKAADSMRPLHLEVDAADEDQLTIRGGFGAARALIRLRHNDEGWQVDRGGVRVDGVAAALPAHAGFRIEGAIDRFVLDDWLKLKSDQPGKHQLSDFLRAANVHLNSFGFLGYSWSDVRAIMQAGDNAWRIDVAGNEAAGQLVIPYQLDNAPLQLALTKLNLGEHADDSGDANEANRADPRNVPAIVARVEDFTMSGKHVGAARVTLDKISQGVRLSSGELRNDAFTVAARGAWTAKAKNETTATLTVDVTSSDLLETLRAFNFHDVISAKHANAHANLTWSGGIDENLLGRASGNVHIELGAGQLLNIEPGAGRILGLMSFAALPRRLSLNFKDVTDKGFSFDSVRGDFEFKNGDAFTNNLLLSGPAAEIGIVGRTGFGKHDYDQTAVVAGDIGGSLSVASAVVGGPVLGAAVLAFTRLFKEPLKGVTRRYHRITGPWENPVVERIDAQEAKQNSVEADAAVSEPVVSDEKTPNSATAPPTQPDAETSNK